MRVDPDGDLVQVVQMVMPFVFRGQSYAAGSWVVFSWPRAALTHREYLDRFSKRPTQEW